MSYYGETTVQISVNTVSNLVKLSGGKLPEPRDADDGFFYYYKAKDIKIWKEYDLLDAIKMCEYDLDVFYNFCIVREVLISHATSYISDKSTYPEDITINRKDYLREMTKKYIFTFS